jgi:hypothetical protein
MVMVALRMLAPCARSRAWEISIDYPGCDVLSHPMGIPRADFTAVTVLLVITW